MRAIAAASRSSTGDCSVFATVTEMNRRMSQGKTVPIGSFSSLPLVSAF